MHTNHYNIKVLLRTFLGSIEESPVFGSITDLDDLSSGQELHDEARGDDGRNSELHQSTTIRGQDDTNPVEGIRRVGAHDAKKGDLAANKENEERDRRP